MKRAWMPLYVGDYLADTGHLTTTQHGAYMLLIMHYWRTGGLPNDDKQLSKIAKMQLKFWLEFRPILQDMFYQVGDDPWRHRRIDAELGRMMQISEKRKQAGAKGGTCSAIARVRSMAHNLPPMPSNCSSERKQMLQKSEQMPSNTTANVHHSHSHKYKKEGPVQVSASLATALMDSALREALPLEAEQGKEPKGDVPKPPQKASREDLEAMFARRRAEKAS